MNTGCNEDEQREFLKAIEDQADKYKAFADVAKFFINAMRDSAKVYDKMYFESFSFNKKEQE